MSTPRPRSRAPLACTLLALAALPLDASAQSQLDASQAGPFLGAWTVSMQSDFGPFTFDLDIVDQDGKVAATLTSVEMGGAQPVNDITRNGEALVLAFSANAQGQMFDVRMDLTPEGESLNVWFEVGAGEFSAGGVATRKAS